MEPLRVLIADPDEQLLQSYRAGLAPYGFQVATAAEGGECLDKLRRFGPEVLVLAPDLFGEEAERGLARVREECLDPPLPVIVLCAGSHPRHRKALRAFPMSEGHCKPLTATQLAYRIARILQGVPRQKVRGTVR